MIYINNKIIDYNDDSVLTLGNFDGIHIGHSQLLKTMEACSQESGLKKIVFSFYPHPVSVKKNLPVYTIFSREEKNVLLEKLGIDVFVEYPFDETVLNLSAREFVTDVLLTGLSPKIIVVGKGYRFGKDQQGDVALLKELGREYGFKVIDVEHINDNDSKVSSTKIRELLSNKEFDKIEFLLGKPYYVYGKVVKGKMLGRTIGFPTINMFPPSYKLLPPNGVYITKTNINNRLFFSLTNIGTNPTVNDDDRNKIIETYIYGFEGDLYGQNIKVNFYEWLRGEIKFKNVSELKKQINYDLLQLKNFVDVEGKNKV